MPIPRPADEHTAEQEFRRWRERGDVQALGRVFDRLAPELLLVAAHFTDRGAAEDLVQTTFLTAIRESARWDAARPLLPWLVGVLANLSLREREKGSRVLDGRRVSGPQPAPDPHEESERRELGEAIASALHGLPRHYRQALTLRLVHGLEPAAIAHALGAPPATVKSRLQRGLEHLRRALPEGLRLPAIAVVPLRSLASVREAVLAEATAHAAAAATVATASAAGVAAAGAGVAVGGVVLMKNAVITVVGVALAAALAISFGPWFGAPAPVQPPPEVPASSPTVAAAPLPAAPAAVAEAARSEAQPPPAPAAPSAAATSSVRGRVVDENHLPLANVFVALGDRGFSPFKDQADFLVHTGNAALDPANAFADLDREAKGAGGCSVRSDAAGAFELPPPTNERPHLLAAWRLDRGVRALDVPVDRAAAIEIVLPRDTVVRGTVRSRGDRKPVSPGAVNVWPHGSGMPIAYQGTAADGSYALVPLPPGRYRVRVEGTGFAAIDDGFEVESRAAELQRDFELEPLPVFAPQLVDATGAPWTRARIFAGTQVEAPLRGLLSERAFARLGEMHSESWKVEPVRVDDGGRVHGFVRVPSAKVLSVWAGGEKLFEVPDVDLAAKQLVVALLPLPRVDLQVRLRFEPARAVQPEVELAITDPSGHGADSSRIVARRTTGAFCGLPVPAQFAGRDCGLLVRCDGCAPYYAVVAIPADGTKATHDVVLSPPAFALRGVVVGPDGAPAPKASLQVVDTDGRWFLPPDLARRTAALDGTFAIPDLPRSRVRLLVAADGCACRGLDVDAGGTEPLRIELRAPRNVSVHFPGGLEGAQVRVVDRDGRVVLDDRLSGTMRFGGGGFPVDGDAASLEVLDGASGQVVATGAITSEAKVVLTQREAPK